MGKAALRFLYEGMTGVRELLASLVTSLLVCRAFV